MPSPAVAASFSASGRARGDRLVTHIPPEDRVPAWQKILFSTGPAPYPLKRKSMGEIRAKLESRQGKVRSR
jgi:hypothetical protein